MNRPSQRRANPHHPHTMKSAMRRDRRHARSMAIWHARWEAEQYGGSCDETPSEAVCTRLARALCAIETGTSYADVDLGSLPDDVRRSLVERAACGDFTAADPEHQNLTRLFKMSLMHDDGFHAAPAPGTTVRLPPSETAILVAIDEVMATANPDDVDVCHHEGGDISLFFLDSFAIRRIDRNGDALPA